MKTPIKYLLRDYRHVIIIMYLCIYLVMLLIAASNYLAVRIGSSNGVETVTAVTIFIVGLNSFKENFKFFSANGVSRRTQFCSTAAALGILSVIFALIDSINALIFTHLTVYSPMFLKIYGTRFGYPANANVPMASPALTLQVLFENFMWLVFLYFILSMIGFFITILYYRMNRALKITVSIAVPVVLMNGIQVLDDHFFQGKIGAFFRSAANAALGITSGHNPYIGMISMLLGTAFFAVLAYLLARKAIVRR